jgi:uncharacterized protein YjbI with pentapeptide repeats
VLTQFRLAAIAAAALVAVGAGQAFALWPFSAPVRLATTPAYGGVCEGCDLAGRDLTGARMTNSVFNRSDFSNAVMARANASGSEFAEANFSGADLRGVRFALADVTSANFSGANIAGADLETAEGLTQRQLNAACGDYTTRVPRGMRVRECE